MDRRARYLEAAQKLFTAHGFERVSMNQLVEEVGGSKATLYRYFASKEMLFEALIDDLAARIQQERPETRPTSTSLADALATLGHSVAGAALHPRVVVLMRLAVAEQQRFPALARTLYENGTAVSYRTFHEIVADYSDEPGLRIPDVQIAAEQFISGIVGLQQLKMFLGVGGPAPEEVEQRVDSAVRSFFASYADGRDRAATALGGVDPA